MNMTVNVNNKNSYDEIPYESFPYVNSHPLNMMTLATLFGMQPAEVENARVLEIGCATGGNILPLAINYPKAKFVGVDLSKVHIDQALQASSELKLKNIEFYNCSVADIDNNFGKFDYIICHAVISYVAEDIRKKILEVCSNNLNPNGVAYVSYNTLPGWNMVRTVRDMMLYHSNFFEKATDKISQSRMFLNFINESLAQQTTPYAQMLKAESEILANQPDFYLRHDHLEEENKQFYFSEFMQEATKENLQYLADCNLSSMFIGNMPASVAEKLQEVQDIVRTEQYMDFITNRRFRASLLVHNSTKINRTLNDSDIEKFCLSMNILADKPLDQVKLDNAEETLSFTSIYNKEMQISTSSPLMKAIFYSLAENLFQYISFDKLVAKANKKLGGKKADELKAELLKNSLRMVLAGHMNISLKERITANTNLPEKPKVSPLVQYQTTKNPNFWVTNNRHEAVNVNVIEKLLLSHMNGARSKSEIIELLKGNFAKGDFNIHQDDKKIDDFSIIASQVEEIYDQTVSKAMVQALLV